MEANTKTTCSKCGFYKNPDKYCDSCIWWDFMEDEMKKEYFIKLKAFIGEERRTKEIYPAPERLFEAFALCNYWDLKVVILGQDPYYTSGTAHGLAFSTLKQEAPPSLQNIFKEIKDDIYPNMQTYSKTPTFKTNNLSSWAKQGVLLLNTILTVQKGESMSHKGKGWEEFTKNTITWLNSHPNKIVYMLWGNNAKEYKEYIDTKKHVVLEATHPSPHSVHGFWGCKHFSQANEFILRTYNGTKSPIAWHLLT